MKQAQLLNTPDLGRINPDSGYWALSMKPDKAHARRKFFDLYEATQSPIAKEALDRINALYGIESEIRGKPPDERRAVRQARAGPLLEDLRSWLLSTARRLSKKSDAAVAIRYTLSRWEALCRYRDDGCAAKKTRALGVKARGPQAPGFCDRQPRRVNLSRFKARQLDEKGHPKATF